MKYESKEVQDFCDNFSRFMERLQKEELTLILMEQGEPFAVVRSPTEPEKQEFKDRKEKDPHFETDETF